MFERAQNGVQGPFNLAHPLHDERIKLQRLTRFGRDRQGDLREMPKGVSRVAQIRDLPVFKQHAVIHPYAFPAIFRVPG